MNQNTALLRFGNFELDLEKQELRKQGALVKLQAQPFRVLALLAERSGDLIDREQIRHHVWGSGTFVDFDQGINVCIRQIRHALGDHATSPRFVETVPRKGYRFLAPVDRPKLASVRELRRHPTRRWAFASLALITAVSALTVGTLVAGRDRSPDSPATTADLMKADVSRDGGVTAFPRRGPHEATPSPKAIAGGALAVLPFQSYSADPGDDYLGDGLTEELITEISRRYGGRIGVIARTSAMKYKRSTQSIKEIASELGVEYVLEGSVRRTRDRLRITAQLIRADDELHLWAGNYDRSLDDVIALQSEVSGKIGQALALELQLELPNEAPGRAATGAPAYEAYLRGRHELARRDANGFWPEGAVTRALEHLERATELDPGFAPAWVEQSIAYRAGLPTREGAQRARRAIERALALDDASPRAHRAFAMLHFYYDWDLEAARASFERALDIDPGYAAAHHDFAAYYSVTGRHDDAVASVRRALRLDPMSPGVASDVGWYYYFSRRFREAIEHSQHTLELEPDYFWAKRCIILAAMAIGDFEIAVTQARKDLPTDGTAAKVRQAIEGTEPEDALTVYWQWRLDRMRAAGTPPPAAIAFANVHMALGDSAAALEALERAHRERRGWILPFLGVHPLFDPLRPVPRFKALVDRIAGS